MSEIKQETKDYLADSVFTKFDQVFSGLATSFGAKGITAATLGIDRDTVARIVDETFCVIYTAEEIEEMVDITRKYEKRNEIVNQLVGVKMNEVLESNREEIEKRVQEILSAQ